MKQLLENPETWNRDILSAFYREYPFFADEQVAISIIQKDVGRGYALGRISIGDFFVIPVIIDDFLLKDFDVALVNGKTIPITPDVMVQFFSKNSPFASLDNRAKASKMTQLFSPELTYPENNKTAALLPTMDEDTQNYIIDFYDQRDTAQFVLNKTAAPLEAIVTADPAEPFDLEKHLSDELSRDRQYIHKVARDRYRLYQGNSQIDDPIRVEITGEEALKFKSKFAEAKLIEEETPYVLKATSSEMKTGSEGVLSDGEKHVKIAVLRDEVIDGNRTVIGTTDKLAPISCTITKVAKITETAPNEYLVPETFKFYELEMEGGVKVAHSTANQVIKTQQRFTFKGPVFDKYASNGHKTHNVDFEDAMWIATSCNASGEDLVKISMMKHGSNMIFPESNLEAPTPFKDFVEKFAEVTEQEKVSVYEVREQLPPILKLAAKVKDVKTVDSMLALGLINDKNVKEFLDMIPAYELVASNLAKLLLMVRLGQEGIPEKDVEEAMEALAKVITYLKNVKSTKESK